MRTRIVKMSRRTRRQKPSQEIRRGKDPGLNLAGLNCDAARGAKSPPGLEQQHGVGGHRVLVPALPPPSPHDGALNDIWEPCGCGAAFQSSPELRIAVLPCSRAHQICIYSTSLPDPKTVR